MIQIYKSTEADIFVDMLTSYGIGSHLPFVGNPSEENVTINVHDTAGVGIKLRLGFGSIRV